MHVPLSSDGMAGSGNIDFLQRHVVIGLMRSEIKLIRPGIMSMSLVFLFVRGRTEKGKDSVTKIRSICREAHTKQSVSTHFSTISDVCDIEEELSTGGEGKYKVRILSSGGVRRKKPQ